MVHLLTTNESGNSVYNYYTVVWYDAKYFGPFSSFLDKNVKATKAAF